MPVMFVPTEKGDLTEKLPPNSNQQDLTLGHSFMLYAIDLTFLKVSFNPVNCVYCERMSWCLGYKFMSIKEYMNNEQCTYHDVIAELVDILGNEHAICSEMTKFRVPYSATPAEIESFTAMGDTKVVLQAALRISENI